MPAQTFCLIKFILLLTLWFSLSLALQQLTGVTKLNLYGCKRLSDAGMTFLQGLPLVALSLGQTRIRDEGLSKLTVLTSLTELHLVKEEVREMALRSLSSLTGLEVLSLRDMKLTNQTVAVSHDWACLGVAGVLCGRCAVCSLACPDTSTLQAIEVV